MKKIFFFFIITLLFSKDIDNIKIYTENYPPYNMEVNAKITGLSSEILAAMLKQMHSKLTLNDVKLVPWARGYSIVLKKKNTMLYSTTRTKQREPLFKWVGPITDTVIGIIALKKRHLKIKNIKDLNKLKIGAVLNDIGEQLLLKNGIKKSHIDAISGKNPVILNLKKLAKGRIDAFAYETRVALKGAKSYLIDPKEFEVVYILKKSKLYYAFNKKTDDKIVKAYQKALNEIKKNGIYKKIISKY